MGVYLLIRTGNMYNNFPYQAKLFMGISSIISGLWSLSFHFVFNGLNAKNDYRLLKFWMKLTMELPVKSDEDYRVAGLSQDENKSFWLKEKHVNQVWNVFMNIYIACIGLTLSSQLFLVKLSK